MQKKNITRLTIIYVGEYMLLEEKNTIFNDTNIVPGLFQYTHDSIH